MLTLHKPIKKRIMQKRTAILIYTAISITAFLITAGIAHLSMILFLWLVK